MKKEEGYQTKEKEHFDKLAESTGETWWGSTTPAGIRRLRRRAWLIKEKLQAFNDPLVLEIGCGTGALSGLLLEETPLLRLIGCDISPKAIEIASKRYRHYSKARFEIADITASTYPEECFEAIVGNSILHHLPHQNTLRECFRILKPGGIILFSEPNMINPQIVIEKNIRIIGKRLQNTDDETAFIRWPLVQLMREIGFNSVDIRPFDFLHPITPAPLIDIVERIGFLIERLPILKEISGSLWIQGRKPSSR